MQPPSPMPYSPRTKRPFFKRTGVRLVLVLLIAGGAWYQFGTKGKDGKGGQAAATVRIAIAQEQQIPITLNAVGTVVAYETVAIRSRIDSQVTAVHFKDGDEVKKGDVLFELDDKSLRAQADQLTANIARDRAALENARLQSARAKALAAKGFATGATRDDTAANEQVAQATVNASIAALESVRVQLGYTRITAPITGRTGTINVTLGNNVKANDLTLVTINQLKPIRIQAALPQQYFDAVRAAMQSGGVTVSASRQDDATGSQEIAQGTLDYIDNAIDASTGTFVTRAGFPNLDERLLPGMFVTSAMTLGSDEHALTVPEVAVQHGQDGEYVFVVVGDKAMKRGVKVARLQGSVAVIASGLETGTQVVIDGQLGVKDGTVVAIAKDPVPAPVAAETPSPAPAAAMAPAAAAPAPAPAPAAEPAK